MAILLPKLTPGAFDLAAVRDWIERIIVYFELQVEEDLESAIAPGFTMVRASTTNADISGWFPCDGRVISQSDYPQLFQAIGSAFNTGGEGAGNFRIPTSTLSIGGVACRRYIKHD